jgi:tetratricopeptide (TPR) repeat protein
MKTLLFFLVLSVTCHLHTHAQLLLPQLAPSFTQGLALFQEKKYESAQHHLVAYIRSHENSLDTVEAQYYVALCAIKLDQPDGAELLHQFLKTYPQHHKAVLAYCQLGNFYFANQEFAKSITYYLQVDKSALDKAAQYEWQYRLAYAYLNEKNFEQASTYFNDIKEHEHAYCYAASYYAGYVAFRNEDYATALGDLMKASKNEAYQSVVPCLVLQAYYKQKKFRELLDYAQAIKSTEVVLKEKNEIALLVAEACFFTGDYEGAVQHYEEYMALEGFVVPSEVLYRTAYALYSIGHTHKALKHFKELALQEDAIGQSASYYTGLLYLKTDQKILALAALDKAKGAIFFTDIREEAAFQHAKVSYELGHFSTTIEALTKFKKEHATSKYLHEADALLSESYLRTNNYDLAIMHIEGLATQSERIRKVYQKVTFHRGSEYFNNAAYTQAISLFRKSLAHSVDQGLALQTQLWLGESLSAVQQYEQAILVYQRVLENLSPTDSLYQRVIYGLGYAYFNTANYAQALPQFTQYINHKHDQAPTLWLQDALLRLADCYYATKQYQQSLSIYEQALQYQPAHVHYQKGMIYSILDDKDAARTSFQAIFNDYVHTVYYEKALFEIAHIDLVQNNYPQAIKRFTEFIQKKPHSTLLPDALLSRTIAHVNLEQYSQATQDYEQLLAAHAKHPIAQSALLELSKICTLQGDLEKFNQYLTDYQAANPDPDALEKVTFDTAKALFYDQRYAAAIAQLQRFLARYPKSKLLPEAHFLVAEAYYRQDDAPSALIQYKAALQQPQTFFYNKILLRMGNLLYQQRDFVQSLKYYQQLSGCAQSEKEHYHALSGMMKASHALKRYEAVQKYASQIIKKGNLTVNATSEATLFMGQVAMQQGRHQEARAYFTQTVQNAQDKHAAEAQYLLAQLHYEAGEYQQSLVVLFELNKKFSAYKAWTNKSFLLIAENYLALKENFQAKATLQSIIENAEESAIVASAQQKLEVLACEADLPTRLSDTEAIPPGGGDEFKTLKD